MNIGVNEFKMVKEKRRFRIGKKKAAKISFTEKWGGYFKDADDGRCYKEIRAERVREKYEALD
ncbi:MAG: hypothetical protein LBE35_01785 [Clostridiales bacterium]|jgi:hypothetical protein|nr:hypothetical protein [Clostridiales bacterium]